MTTTSTSTSSDITERKIENTVEGLPSDCFNFLHNRVLPASRENAITICDYISSLKSEINPSDGYRDNTVTLLCKFSIFFNGVKPNSKLFKEVTREDVLSFLDSFRKIESVDPLQSGSEHIISIEYNLCVSLSGCTIQI